MGLDMFAFKTRQRFEEEYGVFLSHPEEEFFYWRKNRHLHNWMKELYEDRGGTESFNQIALRLTFEDLNRLETRIHARDLPDAPGFFFGDTPYCEREAKTDLEFISEAREAIRDGYTIIYDSSW